MSAKLTDEVSKSPLSRPQSLPLEGKVARHLPRRMRCFAPRHDPLFRRPKLHIPHRPAMRAASLTPLRLLFLAETVPWFPLGVTGALSKTPPVCVTIACARCRLHRLILRRNLVRCVPYRIDPASQSLPFFLYQQSHVRWTQPHLCVLTRSALLSKAPLCKGSCQRS